jgi:hypothetical protein
MYYKTWDEQQTQQEFHVFGGMNGEHNQKNKGEGGMAPLASHDDKIIQHQLWFI